MDSIKDVLQSSMKVHEFDKHLKKAGGHIGQNVVEITIKMKIIVRKPLLITRGIMLALKMPSTIKSTAIKFFFTECTQ